MKKIAPSLLLLTSVLALGATVFSQKEFEKYKPRTLAEIPLVNREATDDILRKAKLEEKQDFISKDPFYSRSKVEFTGRQRPVSTEHEELIKIWSKLQRVDKKITSLYENEFLFKEGDKEYWIPVQKPVGEAMLKELKANDMIILFVLHVGGRKAAMKNDFEWLFLSTTYGK
jgi:hypothetical protein